MVRIMSARSQVRSILLRIVGCAFFVYHMLAVTVANLNTSTRLRDVPHRWFRPYTTFFVQWQEWDMFTTIPYYAAITPTLVATNADNSVAEYGPWLPGLAPIPDSLRITSMFARTMWSRSTFGDAIARWEQAACKAVLAHTNTLPKTVHVKLDTQRLNPLQAVRTSKQIAHPERFSTKPTVCRR